MYVFVVWSQDDQPGLVGYSDHGGVASVTLVGDTPGCKYKLETQLNINLGFILNQIQGYWVKG